MNKMISIIDDSPTIRIFVEQNLLNVGYSVHSFENGDMFFRWLSQVNSIPDIVMIDIDPPLSGLTIIQAMKEDYGQESTFVLMSGRNHTASEIQSWSSLGYVYLQKPFVIRHLLSLLEEVVLRSNSHTNSSINQRDKE